MDYNIYKIILNGVDVTHDTFDVDKNKCTIKKYKRSEKGHYYIENGVQAFEELTGNITLELIDGTIEELKIEKKKKGSVVNELDTDTVRQDEEY